MQKQLAAVVDSLESAQSKLRRFADTVAADAWSRRPGNDRWSAADCVEHLNLTSRAYVPLLRDAIARARELGGPTKRYRLDLLGRFMSMMIGPLHHIGKFRIGRVKTTPPFRPRGGETPEELLSDFVRLQAELITLIRSADGLPLDRVKIVSPFGGRMKYNAYSAIVIVARHEHRHIQQAEEAAA
ncbi:MAG: DinB family protein [Gemmatimonadaceae bacterium]